MAKTHSLLALALSCVFSTGTIAASAADAVSQSEATKATESAPGVSIEHSTGEPAHHSTVTHDPTGTGEAHHKNSKVSCVDPHACCEESKQVLEVLQKMVHAYTSGDLETFEKYTDDHCTTFDEGTKKLVTGKEAVMTDLKKKFELFSPTGETPLVSFTIDHPYAKVTGDTAVVTFVAYRELGGKHPVKQYSNVTDIFVKHEGIWRKAHYRGAWKKQNS